jgi:uncharacterized protein
MANAVIHWEIVGKDAKKLQDFYGKLFDWKIDANNPMNYGMVNTGGERGINGGIGPAPEGRPGYLTLYVEVPNLEDHLKKVGSLGGKTLMPPMQIPNGPRIAMFADPEGTAVGLVQGGTL